ncbi:MAG: HEAT repeat domain-containing protein [Candidatus Bipolaricaulota bacterium]
MIETLQNFQEALGSFVLPLVIAMCGLLVFVIIFYSVAVFLHWKSRKDRENLRKAWKQSLGVDGPGLGSEDLSQIRIPFSDLRDDFLEVLRTRDLTTGETIDIYQRIGFYDQDKADLTSRSWWRRVQALNRLKHLSLAGLQDELTSLVHDSNHEVRLIALDSLSYLNEVPDLDPVELFESFSEKLDSLLVIKLLTMKPPKGFLRPLVDSKNPRLRRAGATLMGQSEKTKLVPLLSRLTGDEDCQVRRRAAESLGKIGGIKSLSILKQTSKDEEPRVREASAISLGKILNEDSIEILNQLARDDNFSVRLTAFSSLARYGEEGRKAIGNHWTKYRRLAREAIFESYQESITSPQDQGAVF